MPDKISKDGTRLCTAEYEVRPLDTHGDAVDVLHYDTRAEAMAEATATLAAGYYSTRSTPISAVVVEKHVRRYPAHLHAEPDTYTTVATMGDRAALENWGA